MAYPSLNDYNEALQHPKTAFIDPELKEGSIETTGLGLPLALCGGFALTYTVKTSKKKYAVRCFHKESPNLESRYRAIERKIRNTNSRYFVNFEFQNEGVQIKDRKFPVVKMEWAKGQTLGDFLCARHNDTYCLSILQKEFEKLDKFLKEHKIAHGDIQPENIMVSDDGRSIQLIDYDGMFVEDLLPLGSSELGHRNFQHPKRTKQNWNANLDRFSFILFYLIFHILQSNPKLWEETNSDSEGILLKANDFIQPKSSLTVKKLLAKTEQKRLVQDFLSICANEYDTIPALGQFINGENIPVVILPKEQPDFVEKHGYISPYPVLNAHKFSLCAQHVGERVEVIGRIEEVFKSSNDNWSPFVFLNFGEHRNRIFKVTIWKNALSKFNTKPDYSWEGKYVKIVGLMEEYATETRYHVQINITHESQLKFISLSEARFYLGIEQEKPSLATKNKEVLKNIGRTTAVQPPTQQAKTSNQKVLETIQSIQQPPQTMSPAQGRAPQRQNIGNASEEEIKIRKILEQFKDTSTNNSINKPKVSGKTNTKQDDPFEPEFFIVFAIILFILYLFGK